MRMRFGLPCRRPLYRSPVPEEPLAQLPDEIVLTRDQAAIVLFGLDAVEQAELSAEEVAKVTRAVHLLTAKLWPDLGDLLDGDET